MPDSSILPSNVEDPRFVDDGSADTPAKWTGAGAFMTDATMSMDEAVEAGLERLRHYLWLLTLPIQFLWWLSGVIFHGRD
jgi:hypothetical protein